jgi:hypothetical protein
MSLLKLWNTITGRSAAQPHVDDQVSTSASDSTTSKVASTTGHTSKSSVTIHPVSNSSVSKDSKPSLQSLPKVTSSIVTAANVTTANAKSPSAESANADPVKATRTAKTTRSGKATKAASKSLQSSAPTIKIAFESEAVPTVAVKPVRPKVNRRDPLVAALLASPMLVAAQKNPSSVSMLTALEIGIGDGTRAAKICDTLREVSETIRYIAIDQFEMGGGNLKLMDFHRMMRTAEVRPQVFPEPVASGLLRVAHTFGACDLILVDESIDEQQLGGLGGQLARIAHESTQVLLCKGGKWHVYPLARADLRRTA